MKQIKKYDENVLMIPRLLGKYSVEGLVKSGTFVDFIVNDPRAKPDDLSWLTEIITLAYIQIF